MRFSVLVLQDLSSEFIVSHCFLASIFFSPGFSTISLCWVLPPYTHTLVLTILFLFSNPLVLLHLRFHF